MPTPQVVDRFNVDGQDYAIEPVLDPIPTQDSPHAVASGGVFADKSNVPVEGSTKNFTAAGAFDFFAESDTQGDWFSKALGPMMYRKYELWTGFKDAYSTDNTAYFWGIVHGVWYGFRQNENTLVCSLDGENWQDTTGLRSGWVHSNSVYYGGGKWVALEGVLGYLAYSTDGINFQESLDLGSYAPGGSFGGMAWVHDRWFVLIRDTNSKVSLYYTTDLQELHLCGGSLPSVIAEAIHIPVYAHGTFVCTVDAHGIYTSSDGSSFTQVYNNATYLYGTTLCIDETDFLGIIEKDYIWITLCGVNDNNTNWRLMYTDDPSSWYLQKQIAPSEDGFLAYEFNGTVLLGARAKTAGTACKGLYALRPARGSGYDEQDLPTYNGWELANLKLDGYSFGSIESIGCINGTWFVYSQSYASPPESRYGWRLSNDLEHWETVKDGSGRRLIAYTDGKVFFPAGSQSHSALWKVSSAKTLLKEFAREIKFNM